MHLVFVAMEKIWAGSVLEYFDEWVLFYQSGNLIPHPSCQDTWLAEQAKPLLGHMIIANNFVSVFCLM